MKIRRETRARLLEEGREPYPVDFPRMATIAEIRQRYGDLPTDTASFPCSPTRGR